ncbi:MAG: hypothetical protein ACJ763_06520 [Bdellovibrionia bacterium]
MRLVRAFQILELISSLVLLQSYPAVASQTRVLDPMKWVQETGGPYWGYGYLGDNAKTGAYLGAFTPIQPSFSPAGIVIGLPPLPDNLPPGASPYAENAVGFSIDGASIDVILTTTSTDNLYCHAGAGGITVPNVKVTYSPIELSTLSNSGPGGAEIVCWNLGKSYIFITISRFSITYHPDVFVGALQISQPDSVRGSDGLLQVKPGVPIQVRVPVGGDVGLIDSTNQTTTVVLQVGSQPPQTRIIRAEEIVGGLLVPFEVTFNESEKGAQTISATVSPNNIFQESYLSNNTLSAQVTVGPPYKLTLSLSQEQVYPDMSDIGQTPGSTDAIVTAKLTTTSGSPVSGKMIQFSITPKDGSGGHAHADGRPIGDFKNDEDSCTTLNDGTCTVTYTASQFGGIETILGVLASSPTVKDSKDLTVRIPGLSPLSGGPYTFKCVVFPNAPACLPSYGHSSTYNVISSVDSAMFAIGAVYNNNYPDASPLIVNDASLAFGGLYDKNSDWQTPHTYHRAGTDIDIRSLTTIGHYGIPQDNRRGFKSAVCFAGGYPKLEYSGDSQNEHYHLYFKAYKPSISELCSNEE